MSYVPTYGNFAVQEFPADKFQFKNSDLGKFYQGLEAWCEKIISDGVPKGSRTPVAAVKGRSPRPLDDGDQQPHMVRLIVYFVNNILRFSIKNRLL